MLGIFHNEKEERTLRWIISVKFFSFTWLLYIIQHFGCFFYTDKIDLDDSLRIYVIPISFLLESSNTHTLICSRFVWFSVWLRRLPFGYCNRKETVLSLRWECEFSNEKEQHKKAGWVAKKAKFQRMLLCT